MAKLYVGNLVYELEPRELEDEFARFGKVEECSMKRGFAFVHFQEARDAEAAVQEMDNQEWRGRRMKVAFATSTGGGGGGGDSDRRPVSRMGGGGDSRDGGGDAPVSQNLFVGNIPPHLKMSELEAFFEQFGKVANVKILPQARGNMSLSAFVDFAEVADAKRAFEAELVLDGQRLRSDYNIRRGERREFGDRNGGGDRSGGDRRDGRGDRDFDRQGGGGGGYDDRRGYPSRGGDYESHRGSGGGGSNRRERSRSPAPRDRSRERRGSGGSGSGGGDDRYQQRRSDRSPPRSGARDRGDQHQSGGYQERDSRYDMDPHARMSGNDGSYASGSRSSGRERNPSPPGSYRQ